MSTPALWATLYSDSGVSLVVPPDTDPVEALFVLVEEEYGGEFSRTNPVIVAEANGMRIEAWRECSEEEAADYGADLDNYNSWWAPGGSGSEVIHVLSYDGALFDLGERAEAAEAGPDA
jgi:hypothetical protein